MQVNTRFVLSFVFLALLFAGSTSVFAEGPAQPNDAGATGAPVAATTSTEAKPFKGLVQALRLDTLRWLPEPMLATPASKSFAELLITPPAKKKLIDPLFEPTFLLRPIYVTTAEDRYTDSNGASHRTTDLRRTYFGHREGFVLENVELGFKGRHNDTGLYYGAKLEFVPREKDGTKSESDYLKEVYVGWNYYSVFEATAGRIKLPLSQANLKSSADMPLIYAPLIDSLLPKRLLGASVSFSDPWKILKVSGGAFNSVKEPYEQLASSDQLFYATRAELSLDRAIDLMGWNTGSFFNMQLGASYAYCKENYDPRTKLQYRGLDGHLDLYIFTLEGELLIKDYYGEGMTSHQALQGKAWHVDATVHAWPSVLDATVRYEEADNSNKDKVDFAEIASMAVNQKKRWTSFGLLLHVTRQLDISANYVMRGEAEGQKLDNDMFVSMLQFNL